MARDTSTYDAEDWWRLAYRLHMRLGRGPEAVDAYRHAVAAGAPQAASLSLALLLGGRRGAIDEEEAALREAFTSPDAEVSGRAAYRLASLALLRDGHGDVAVALYRHAFEVGTGLPARAAQVALSFEEGTRTEIADAVSAFAVIYGRQRDVDLTASAPRIGTTLAWLGTGWRRPAWLATQRRAWSVDRLLRGLRHFSPLALTIGAAVEVANPIQRP